MKDKTDSEQVARANDEKHSEMSVKRPETIWLQNGTAHKG